MEKSAVRTLAKASGASIEVASVPIDWMIFPTEKKLLEFRAAIPYATTYSGGNSASGFRLTVRYDETAPRLDVQASEDLLAAVERWQEYPAPVNAALVLKKAETWAKLQGAAR
jgi:hypothetical protein